MSKEEMFKSVEVRALKDDLLFDICCVVDNEYRGKRNTFRTKMVVDYIACTTNVCDWAGFIRIYKDRITYLGPDTPENESYREIHPETYKRVIEIVMPFLKF